MKGIDKRRCLNVEWVKLVVVLHVVGGYSNGMTEPPKIPPKQKRALEPAKFWDDTSWVLLRNRYKI